MTVALLGEQGEDRSWWRCFPVVHSRLGEEVGGLFLQASPRAGIMAAPAGARDSGYDSLHRRLSILDRLMHTHAVWLQLGLSHQEATVILQSQRSGVRSLHCHRNIHTQAAQNITQAAILSLLSALALKPEDLQLYCFTRWNFAAGCWLKNTCSLWIFRIKAIRKHVVSLKKCIYWLVNLT